MMRVGFRLDVNSEIGYGHLQRCIILAESFQKRGISSEFYVRADDGAKSFIKNQPISCSYIDAFSTAAEVVEFLKQNIPAGSIIISDLAYPEFIRNATEARLFFDMITSMYSHILIDALGEQSFRENLDDISCHYLISPYCDSKSDSQSGGEGEILAGTSYFIIDSGFFEQKERQINNVATKVLVSFGGSDPRELSANVLESLALVSTFEFEIKVVVGPGFSPEYESRLVVMSQLIGHKVELIRNVSTLAPLMYWCDLAICSSGLTKYELAATGTPSILISIDEEHDRVNKSFANEHTCIDFGVFVKGDEYRLAGEVESLAGDHKTRNMLSCKGLNVIDGKGASRIVDYLLKEIH